MSARDLLDTLDAIGITLRADGDQLSVVGDQKLLADSDLIASLRSHKSDLISLLQQRAASLGGRNAMAAAHQQGRAEGVLHVAHARAGGCEG